MIKREPIQQEDLKRFLDREIRAYAEGHVRNGNWPAESAYERSTQEAGLHVFGDNIAAGELNKKAGFQMTGIPGNKKLT